MSWNDHLLPASFRGVPFHFEDTKRSGGRRLVEHEFPLRDDPYVEDLGRKKREHKITGYVLGDDYIVGRAALEVALDGQGPGTLNHPYRGELTVNVRSWTSQEIRDEGRMARFDIDCVESGSQPSPLALQATADIVLSLGEDMLDELNASFLANWAVGKGGTVGAATALLDDLTAALGQLAGWPGLDTSQAMSEIAGLLNDVSDGAAIASGVSGFFSAYADAVGAAQTPFDESLSSRGPMPLADPSYGLAAMADWGASLSGANGNHVVSNQQALVSLVGGSAVAALAQVYAHSDFHAQDDADAARDQVSDLIDDLATQAADSGDDAVFTAWQALYRSSVDDLTTRAKQAASTLTFTMGGTQPVLALAQRFYQDPSRAGELVARNDAPHPLFMPPTVLALSA